MVKIAVVGSINMDLVVTSDRRPKAGETLFGRDFQTVPGGKGANQAVAAARLGADVAMIGCVGQDMFGEAMIENLKQNGVSIRNVEPVPHVSSGTSHITIAEGDNSIIFVEGANGKLTPSLVEKAASTLKAADIILIQQEMPEETVEYVASFCKEFDKTLIFNPAPAREVSDEVIAQATYITPNEHEFAMMFGAEDRSKVLAKYPNKLIITEGENGVRYFNGSAEVVVPSYKVDPVDTTGAGDTFNGAFAVAIAEGKEIEEALRFANRAASISITKSGAQGGMPTRGEVEELLKE